MSQARNVANLGVHTTTAAGAVTFLDGATDIDIAQHDGTNGLKLGGTLVSATAAELNIMDGCTSSAAELNLLDGVSGLVQGDFTKLAAVDASAAEVNLIDGSSAGTIVNSKAVVYGSSGEVNATTLQLAGSSITATATTLNNAATTGKAIAMAMVFGS